MKSLSIWEPYGSLIALEAKRFETRSWPTKHRGDLLICTAKRGFSNRELDQLLENPHFQEALSPLSPHFPARISWVHLQFGRALCVAKLVWVGPAKMVEPIISDLERSFGDFSPGRFALDLRDVRRFKKPWPVVGRQRLFNVPDEEIAKHELEGL
jgi:hypothetical protein